MVLNDKYYLKVSATVSETQKHNTKNMKYFHIAMNFKCLDKIIVANEY